MAKPCALRRTLVGITLSIPPVEETKDWNVFAAFLRHDEAVSIANPVALQRALRTCILAVAETLDSTNNTEHKCDEPSQPVDSAKSCACTCDVAYLCHVSLARLLVRVIIC